MPRSVASLFWDYPGKRLSLTRDRDLVVRRILAEGGLVHVRYIRRHVGDDGIRDVLQRSQARGLSPQRIRFWQLLLDVPRPFANAWVREASAGMGMPGKRQGPGVLVPADSSSPVKTGLLGMTRGIVAASP